MGVKIDGEAGEDGKGGRRNGKADTIQAGARVEVLLEFFDVLRGGRSVFSAFSVLSALS